MLAVTLRLGLALLGLLVLPGPALAARGSLFGGSRPRPGPPILYARPARAPQLENTGVWRAPPILVSGASAYRRGEFVYQDWLYDDHGAAAPGSPTGDVYAPTRGAARYPAARAFAGNAADLVEFRVRPVPGGTAFRLTLNTLVDPARVAATIAIGSSAAPHRLPEGANASAPAALFLTLHGRTADLRRAGSGALVRPSPRVRLDVRRRQVELRVPARAWDPGRRTVRLAIGVGLWDPAAGRYLLPRPRDPRAAAFFNVGFRAGEPLPRLGRHRRIDPAWWRENEQARELARGDLSPFHAEVDFGKLRRGVTDDSRVPRSGPMDRILASHTETRQGVVEESSCPGQARCEGRFRGRLQPYAIYVPRRGRGAARYGLTLLLHSLTANYNQYLGSRNQSELALRRGGRSIVITPEARGPDGFYRDRAAADVFEVWADVARRYPLDPRRTAITGYSMGAWGAVRLAAQFPDLFARAQETVGSAGDLPLRQLASLRWVPLLMWNSLHDQDYRPTARTLERLRYRFELDEFRPLTAHLPSLLYPQHMSLGVGDRFTPVARFFGRARAVRDPARVSYVVNPAIDFPRAGTTADHAYWLSAIRVRTRAHRALGSLDVRSEGFGAGDPRTGPLRTGHGRLAAGRLGPRAFAWRRRAWGPVRRAPHRDRIDVVARNVRSMTISARRARVTCRARLRVHSDGPITIRLAGCPGRAPTTWRLLGHTVR